MHAVRHRDHASFGFLPLIVFLAAQDHASTTDQKLLLRYRSQALSGLEGLQQFSRVAADESKEWQTGPVRHPDPRQPHLQGTRR